MFPIWKARQWRKLGGTNCQCQLVQEKIIARFQFTQVPPGVTLKALAGHMFDALFLRPMIPAAMACLRVHVDRAERK